MNPEAPQVAQRLARVLEDGRALFAQLDQIPVGSAKSDRWREALHEHLPALAALPSDGWHGAASSLWRFAGQLAALRGERVLVEPIGGDAPMQAVTDALKAVERRCAGSAVRYLAPPMEVRDDGLRWADLRGTLVSEWNRALISVRSPLPTARVRSELRTLYKLGSWQTISAQVGSSSPGAWLRPLERGPLNAPEDPATVWFAVEMVGQAWSLIAEDESLALFAPAPYLPHEAQFQLVAERIG